MLRLAPALLHRIRGERPIGLIAVSWQYGGQMRIGSEATVKRVTLVACILGSGIALLDGTVVNVALPTIQRALGGGLAAQQWVVNGYLLTLGSLILVGGSLGDLYGERKVFAIGVAGFGAASALCAVVAVDRLPRRRAHAPGDRGGAARAELAGGDRQHVPGVRARRCDRHVDGVGGDRGRARAAGRRRAPGDRVVALDLRDQRAAGGGLRVADPRGDPAERCARARRQARRLPGRAAVRARPRRSGVRADRAAASGLVEPGGLPAAARGLRAARGVHLLRVAREGSDAAARAVPPAQLLGGQRRDIRDVRGLGDRVLLPRAVPAADRRLHAAEERPGDAAGDGRHVRPLATLRCARRSLSDRVSSWAWGRSWQPADCCCSR